MHPDMFGPSKRKEERDERIAIAYVLSMFIGVTIIGSIFGLGFLVGAYFF